MTASATSELTAPPSTPAPSTTPPSTSAGSTAEPSVEPLRLLAVHAHPDDEASKGAATMARYGDAGAQVTVVTCTGGERGDVLNKRLLSDAITLAKIEANLPAVRRAEMANAARILGVTHHWLGYTDSGFPEPRAEGDPMPPLPDGCFALVPLQESAGQLAELIRRIRPHVVTTYDEVGGYPHPDHVMTHRVTMAALLLAATTAGAPATAGAAATENDNGAPPWVVPSVFYNQQFHKPRLEALEDACRAVGITSPFAAWLRDWDDERPQRPIHVRVPCADWFGVRDAALRAHATQVDPDGLWFAVPDDISRRAWPTEDFERGYSLLPVAGGIGADLFEGLRIAPGAPHAAPSLAKRLGQVDLAPLRALAEAAVQANELGMARQGALREAMLSAATQHPSGAAAQADEHLG